MATASDVRGYRAGSYKYKIGTDTITTVLIESGKTSDLLDLRKQLIASAKTRDAGWSIRVVVTRSR